MKGRFNFLIIIICTLIVTSCAPNSVNFMEGIENFRAQNYRTAFIRLKPEAEKGQPDAQYAIGYMYYYGQGVVEDRNQAWFWIHAAAKAGQLEAIEAVKILGPTPPVR